MENDNNSQNTLSVGDVYTYRLGTGRHYRVTDIIDSYIYCSRAIEDGKGDSGYLSDVATLLDDGDIRIVSKAPISSSKPALSATERERVSAVL